MATNTMVFPVVRSDLLRDALESFWRVSDRDEHRVIVVDQSKLGLGDLGDLVHIHLRLYRNLGFSKAANTGIRLTDTEYVTICNDDVLFFDERWWPGITTIFARAKNIVAVNPSCPRIPGWSLGQAEPQHIAEMDDREKCLEEGAFDLLMEKTPLRGLVRGICMWCTAFSLPRLLGNDLLGEKGQLFDERFYPGGGEDYDLNARIFRAECQAFGTHTSWVWHDWGMSKDAKGHDGMPQISSRPAWNKIGEIWEAPFSVQGRSARKEKAIHIEPL